mgnify:CR=1 FL=1
MGIVVKKFGGTSVGDTDRIKNVARLVDRYLQENPDKKVVVVASAMSGETDRLIKLAKSCVPSPNPRELDQIVATGEQVSVALLAMALIELGRPAKSFLAPQIGIETDERHTNARIQGIETERINKEIAGGVIPVIAGFQGVNEDGDITTLGRGGSDTTAVAVAAAVKADCCYIYTDVEGVLTADPRIVKNAKFLKRIAHEEMLELASLGAKVLHPRSVDFALRYDVPLVVLSTFNPGPGTWIVKEEELVEKPIISGITHRTDEVKLTILKLPKGIQSLSTLFSLLGDEAIFIDMITQTGIVKDKTNISFTVPDEAWARTVSKLNSALSQLGADSIAVDRDIAKVSVVGVGMKSHTGVAAKVFAVLANEGIDVTMISTSDIKISVVVQRKYSELAVRALHEAFIDTAPTIQIES